MKNLFAAAFTLALALIALMPGTSAAKISSNHNRTLLRG